MMIAAFLLGLTGSVGHCVGMCSGVVFLLTRRGNVRGRRALLLHLGRVTTYGALGAGAGGIGYSLISAISYCTTALAPGGAATHDAQTLSLFSRLQGGLALCTAVLALYMGLSLFGLLPSPELLFGGLTRRWGQMARRLPTAVKSETEPRSWSLFSSGLLWGLLPCGLVMTALLAAAVSGSVWRGGLTMVAFGAGTWPVTAGISVLAARRGKEKMALAWPKWRYAAALIVFAFGAQMALRGIAAWGWITHYYLGEIVLW